jgi:hypothetical protein
VRQRQINGLIETDHRRTLPKTDACQQQEESPGHGEGLKASRTHSAQIHINQIHNHQIHNHQIKAWHSGAATDTQK